MTPSIARRWGMLSWLACLFLVPCGQWGLPIAASELELTRHAVPILKDAKAIPLNFRREALVAWCIVPFDARERSPEDRAVMLRTLGLRHCAYDWRERHVPLFERELLAYARSGITMTAFWETHPTAWRLFRERGVTPAIWKSVPPTPAGPASTRIQSAVDAMVPIARKCQEAGCSLALYNHGGWEGEPANLVAVCRGLHDRGFPRVGIVYNFHHAHDHITDLESWASAFRSMLPHLLCVNLNGMVDLTQFSSASLREQKKILPIGRGTHEVALLRMMLAADYRGPIGLLGHVANRDVADVLRENVEGLEYLLGARGKPDWLTQLEEADYLAKWTPQARADSRFPYEKEGEDDWTDTRPQTMDRGPWLCHSIHVPLRSITDHRPEDRRDKSNDDEATALIPKAIALRGPNGDRHCLFDTEQCNVVAYWQGAFLSIPPARFGILQMPHVAGAPWWSHASVRWQSRSPGSQDWEALPSDPQFHGFYPLRGAGAGMQYRIGATEIDDRIVGGPSSQGATFAREIRRSASTETLRLPICPYMRVISPVSSTTARKTAVVQLHDHVCHITSSGPLTLSQGWVYAVLPESEQEIVTAIQLVFLQQPPDASFSPPEPPPIVRRTTPRWGPPLQLAGELGEHPSGPFVVDTLPLPHDNPFGALLFTSGFDFLDDGRAFVCTVHGDVWLVDGIDDRLSTVSWQRFATGLYQPLGLKVVDGHPMVLCRDRVLRLWDKNGDGEADHYESFNDDLVVTGQSHAYAMSLETDPEGNFYFIKSGDTPPHGGTLLKLTADGRDLSVFATGYRHANGLGVSPSGRITSADNEGNWVPSTRIDLVRQGGFYGHVPTHRRAQKPHTYDRPLVWLPRSLDNSAGGQVWVPAANNLTRPWPALAGKMIHLSFGRCTANVVLPQVVEDQWQAAAYALHIPTFQSGAMRGRFHPRTGDLYVCGLDGWQTAAREDGHLQRVRATGQPLDQPTNFAVFRDRCEISFDVRVAEASILDGAPWSAQRWNYRWTEAYGSDHYRPDMPDTIGHETLSVDRVTLRPDGKTVVLWIDDLQPVMQMHLRGEVRSLEGRPLEVNLFHTIHALAE